MPNGIETSFKQHAVERIQRDVGLSKRQAVAVFDAIFLAVRNLLAHGESVRIASFGTLSVTRRSARMGRNPATGEKMAIPAQKSVAFKASRAVKETVQ